MSSEQRSEIAPSQTACVWLLNALPHDALYEAIRGLGREAGQLLPGFSLSHRTLQRRSVRALLARALGNHPRLAGRICLAKAAPWQPWVAVLPMLDESWLLRHWRELVRHYGPALAVAIALDERESLGKRGVRLLSLDTFWRADRPNQGKLPDGWGHLVNLLGGAREAESGKEKHDNTDVQRVHELEQQSQQLREAVDRSKRKTKEAEAEVAGEREARRAAQQESRRQLKAKEEEIASLQDQFEERLRQQIIAFREQLLAVPPEPPATGNSEKMTLAARASQILDRQAVLDRQRGTRPLLHAELEELEELERRLRRCGEESLVLVPGLSDAALQVGQRLRDIREQLGELDTDTEAPDLAAAMFCRLKNAHLGTDASAELAHLKDILELDVVREVLGPRTHGRLLKLERTRSQLARDRSLDQVTLPETVEPAPARDQEVWNLAERLQCFPAGSVWLFIDGYNAIRRVPDLHRLEREHGMAAARDRFCALCRRRAHQFGHLEIVFDGVESTAASESCAGVRIVYSRAAGDDQNADEHLVRRLHAAPGPASATWLVTDDFGLRERVLDCCDAFVPPVLLYRFLTTQTK